MTRTFPRKEKLKNKLIIDRLFKEGEAITVYPLKLIYTNIANPMEVRFQVAVSVPKSNFKNAVHRNRIKRLLRENYRLNKENIFNNMEGNFAFLFLYLGKDIPENAVVERCMLKIFKKLIKKTSNAKIAE